MRKMPHNVLPKKELEKDNKSKFILCLLSIMIRLHCVMRYRKEGLFTFRFSGGRLNTGWIDGWMDGWMDGQMMGCMRNRNGE